MGIFCVQNLKNMASIQPKDLAFTQALSEKIKKAGTVLIEIILRAEL